jgi:predicted AAA+ superfamily ATPase
MPLSESDDDNLYKLFMSDIGLLRCMADVPPNYVQTDDEKYKYHKGGITENFVITEMIGAYPKGLHYWTDGRYEVDLIVESNLSVVPIEIKSGRRVKAKSLARYIDKYAPERIIAVSMEEAKKGRVESVPLYCAGSLKDILGKD